MRPLNSLIEFVGLTDIVGLVLLEPGLLCLGFIEFVILYDSELWGSSFIKLVACDAYEMGQGKRIT